VFADGFVGLVCLITVILSYRTSIHSSRVSRMDYVLTHTLTIDLVHVEVLLYVLTGLVSSQARRQPPRVIVWPWKRKRSPQSRRHVQHFHSEHGIFNKWQ
jgi:hypothetical protein